MPSRTQPDLLIVVDTNSLDRIGDKMQKVTQSCKKVLFVDHHPCSEDIAKNNCIDVTMAATGELVGWIIDAMDIKFTKELALPLYTAIVIDTSSFRYPTVKANTHRIIAKLMDTGINITKAYGHIYGPKSLGYIHMLGHILSSVQCNKAGTLAWLVLKEEVLHKFAVDIEDTLGMVNNLLILENIEVACAFLQIKDQVKVSLRSMGKIDVSIIAQKLGGGGHEHSAATVMKAKNFDQTVSDTMAKVEIMLGKTI